MKECNLIRFFDIIFSLLLILLFSPLFIFVSIFLYFTGEHEVLYLQTRVGQFGAVFKLIKFATMLKSSETMGTGTLTIFNDPRVLPYGRFLRKSKLNELPQLFNIFIGQMSFIGPRPLTPDMFSMYDSSARNEICKLKPGMSGIGSIIFRNEDSITKNASDPKQFYSDVIAPYKADLEIWYCNNNSLITYFNLIFLTIIVVILPNTHLPFILFRDLPPPPTALSALL